MKSILALAADVLLGYRVTRCEACHWRTRRGERALAEHRESRCLG